MTRPAPRNARSRERVGWRGGARTAVRLLLLTPLLLVLSAGAAAAADGSKLGQTPPALSWIHLKDSRGISVWNYELSLDRGGITSPGKVVWSIFIDLFWQLYRSLVVIAIWFIDWVLSFSWLTAVSTPVLALSRNLETVTTQLGGTLTLLTVAAVVAVVWMMRGRWSLGVYELFVSLFIAALSTGVLAHPVQTVAGPHGLVMQSRDFGLEVSDGLAHGGTAGGTAGQLRAKTVTTLTDTFVRQPAQMLNFGTVLDGGKCEKTYDKVVKAGPYGDGSQIRDAVAGCDSTLGDVAANPGSGQAISAAIITPASLLVLVFAVVLAGTVFLAALHALYQSLKSVVTLLTGLLPGSARGALWQTIADLVIALVTVSFSIVFLTGYLLVIQGMFTAGQPGDGVMATFFFVDILLAAGIYLFWRARGRLRAMADRLAAALATRPGSGPSALPQRRPFDPVRAYYTAKMAGNAVTAAGDAAQIAGERWASGRDRFWQKIGAGAHTAAAGARYAGDGAGWWVRWARGGNDGDPGGASRAAGPGGGPPTPQGGGGGAAGRMTELVRSRHPATGRGQLTRVAARTALSVATSGGTTALTAAAGSTARRTVTGVVVGGRRAQVAGRLAAARPALPAAAAAPTTRRALPAGTSARPDEQPQLPAAPDAAGSTPRTAGPGVLPPRAGASRTPAAPTASRRTPDRSGTPAKPTPPPGVDSARQLRAALQHHRRPPLALPAAAPIPPTDAPAAPHPGSPHDSSPSGGDAAGGGAVPRSA